MHLVELQNLKKSRNQLQQKLSSIQRLLQKLQQMDKRMTCKGHVISSQQKQKINSVMMRNVQIKHTSELMIKLSEQYFVEVKTNTALDYLGRRRKNYEESLKNISLKIEVMESRIKQKGNKKGQEQFLQSTYSKSTVEAIGKNEQGEQIFNIIEVQDQQEDTQAEQKSNQSTKEQTKKEQKTQLPQSTITKTENTKVAVQRKSSSGESQSEEGGDLLLDQGDYSSGESSLEEIQEDQNDDELKQQTNKKQSTTKQQNLNPKTVTQSIKTETKPTEIQSKQPIKQTQKKAQTKSQTVSKPLNSSSLPKQEATKKPQKVQPAQQPPKPISRFKLQRMKQKLQQSIQ